jgi:hypothetical protein
MWTALAALSIGLAQAQEPPTPTPMPSTNPTEGTAADRTPPGETTTRDPSKDPSQDAATNPRPSTSESEGTLADRTSPGDKSSSNIVGAQVVSKSDAPIGKVVDVVFDAKDQPAFVVIASGGNQAAVPYAAASEMMEGNRVVMDQSRLDRAPKVKQGEWRSQTNDSTWQQDSANYWMKGQRQPMPPRDQ